MRSYRKFLEVTAVFVVFFVLCIGLPSSPALAGWAPTRSAVDGPRARLVTLLERQDIVQALGDLGVDPAEAARRVSGLTDAEAQEALDRFQSLPAAGDDVFGAIIGAVLIVFLVLLLTDLLGLTHFFPFTKKR